MSARFVSPRLLPATIVAMGLVTIGKCVDLARAAGAAPEAATPLPPLATPLTAPPKQLAAPPEKPAEPAMSEAERALLLDLRHRREALDQRAHELDQRESVTEAAEKKLASRVDELTALQARLEQMDAARHEHDAANWTGLVRVYEAMKPRDAATIFDALDMQVLLGVLDRMNERRVAPILAAMQPDRARLATQMLAEMRTRAITPPGEKPPPPSPEPKG